MKHRFLSILAALAVMVAMPSCDKLGLDSDDDSDNSSSSGVSYKGIGPSSDNSPIEVHVSGDIDPNLEGSLVGKKGTVSFNHFPNSLSQFQSVLPTLKETPQGAVVAQLMAMELFHRVPEDGQKAFYLCNVQNNVQMIMERLPDTFGFTGAIYDGEDYARPYQVASFLQGANRNNGYAPSEPYTVKVQVATTGAVYSENYQTNILYLEVLSESNDQGTTPVQVLNTQKPGEPTGWIIFNCPGLYAQCKAISYSTSYKGLK